MKKLAIVSSYNEKCGNASYTHVLKNAFSEHFSVEVIPLDLFVLQKVSPRARALGDAHIEKIAKRLAEFDFVNIQFEAGLYGTIVRDIYKRVSKLISASRNLIFTMHRIDLPIKSMRGKIWNSIKNGKFGRVYENVRTSQFESLYERLANLCKAESRKKNVWISVHTRRERRILRDYFDVPNSFDHPLAYLNDTERSAAWKATDRANFLRKYGFRSNVKILGVFGYISAYKGIETAISALNSLPDNYVLALFGSQHPQSVQAEMSIDPYLKSLLKRIRVESEGKVKMKLRRLSKLPRNVQGIDEVSVNQLVDYDISHRVRFLGNVDDPEFIEALRLCDAVVLPYLEVGQSMSGVVALATECGAKMFCANNASFAEVQKYYGPVFHNFDIGNHVELAQKIIQGGSDFKIERDSVYRKYNISTLVELFLQKFGHVPEYVPDFSVSVTNLENQ